MPKFASLREYLDHYLTTPQIEEITRAFHFADKAHEGQMRSSGDAYITHPIAVATILASMHMDHPSIVAAILHDVIEDTEVNKEAVGKEFGETVSELVDGVSKLTLIRFDSRVEAQAENFRKMMMAMSKDIRVIIIKLADRLHNMRTLDACPRDKQRRIARETLEIYAPIADRLGMHAFRTEFEDLGFRYLYPVRYRVLKEAVKKARGNRKQLIKDLKERLTHRLEQEHVRPIALLGREKPLYSLYKKMRQKDLQLSEVMDVYALRIVVNTVDVCYHTLGIVHNLFKPLYRRFKDYIAVPKANGYQSLHTTVLGPYGVPVEIQIRTEQMNRIAESGISAHWLYKSESADINDAQIRAREWLKGMLEIQEHTRNSLEFLEHIKLDLYPGEVYVFTPGGEILSLPRGATCVDFAYAVHTDIGHACIAAKIDRRLVPLSSRLMSGQTIEIVTAEGAHPNPAWLTFVVTGKARSNIRHWLKTQKAHESSALGKRLIERALSSLSLELSDIPKDRISAMLTAMNIDSVDVLFQEVGLGNQVAQFVARRLAVELPEDRLEQLSVSPLAIQGTEGMVVSYAKCCYPIPGDPILGFVSVGRGMMIHRDTCKNVVGLKKSPEKMIFLQWSAEVTGDFQVELTVEVINRRGALAMLANAISDCNANIENVYIDERDSRHTAIIFLVSIHDRTHLAQIIRRLRAHSLVTRVTRGK